MKANPKGRVTYPPLLAIKYPMPETAMIEYVYNWSTGVNRWVTGESSWFVAFVEFEVFVKSVDEALTTEGFAGLL